MMLSIIIPVYNVEKYLGNCIDSILNQSSNDWELILVDDGSTDLSGVICDEYAKKNDRIRVIHKQNNGASAARNVGISLANGDLISFVDADDIVSPLYCQTIVDSMNDTDLLYFGNRCFGLGMCEEEHSPVACSVQGSLEVEKALLQLKQCSDFEYFGYTWNKCFSRDIIVRNDICFEEGLSYREDDLFTSQYCRHISSMSVTDDVIYSYRITSSGLTVRFGSSDIIRFVRLLDQTTSDIISDNLRSYEKTRMLDLLIYAAKLSSNRREAIDEICSFIAANENIYWLGKYQFMFCGGLVLSRMFCWLCIMIYDFKHILCGKHKGTERR